MNEEAQLLASLWEVIQEYVPTGDKQEVGEALINTLVDFGNDFRLLRDAEGTCTHLDRALAALADEDREPDLCDEYNEDEEY